MGGDQDDGSLGNGMSELGAGARASCSLGELPLNPPLAGKCL